MNEAADPQSTTEATSTDGTPLPEDAPTARRVPDEPAAPKPGDKTALLQALDLRKIGWPGLAVLGVRSSQAAGQTQQRVHDNPEEE